MRTKPNQAVPSAPNDYKPFKAYPQFNPGPHVALPEPEFSQGTAWREHAACKGSALDFLPHSLNLKMIAACKAVCATCPVKEECLQMALEADDKFAVCGGYTYKERLDIKR